MNREKRLTKRERKAQEPPKAVAAAEADHIHCIACGRHIEPNEFDDPATATILHCQHLSSFPSCIGCQTQARTLLETHDRTNRPVQIAAARH